MGQLTQEVGFKGCNVDEDVLFSVRAGVSADVAEEFAGYLLDYLRARTSDLITEKATMGDAGAYHFLLNAIDALQRAARSEAGPHLR